jgi:hypothetical protein
MGFFDFLQPKADEITRNELLVEADTSTSSQSFRSCSTSVHFPGHSRCIVLAVGVLVGRESVPWNVWRK